MNYYSAYGMGGGPYSRGSRKGDAYLSEAEKEAKQKMEAMIEDIMSKKIQNNDVVKKSNSSDVNAKEIPSIDTIDKEDVVKSTKDFISSLKDLSGKEITIVLNKVLESIDSIPTEYKKILQKKI